MVRTPTAHLLKQKVQLTSCRQTETRGLGLNAGLFSEEERASAGAMTALAVSWRWRSTEGRARIRAGARGPSLYDMLLPLAPPEVLEEKLVVSST
jgi:hypothetical protein